MRTHYTVHIPAAGVEEYNLVELDVTEALAELRMPTGWAGVEL